MSGWNGTTDVFLQWKRIFVDSATERNWSSTSVLDGLAEPYGAHMFDHLGRVQKGGCAEPFSSTENAWTQRPALKLFKSDILTCVEMQ